MVRRRICVQIGGQIFRTSLFSAPSRDGQFILVSKQMQKAAAARVGQSIDVTVSPDLEERKPAMPPDLAALMKKEKALTKWFVGLSDATHYQIGKWIEAVKSPEARQRRAEQMAERLMLTMEGEKTPPPILELAFRQSPLARKGWESMTLTQRRGHLLGVFYYQTPDARTKRVARLVEEALRIARS